LSACKFFDFNNLQEFFSKSAIRIYSAIECDPVRKGGEWTSPAGLKERLDAKSSEKGDAGGGGGGCGGGCRLDGFGAR
jgi:hypothetical protein